MASVTLTVANYEGNAVLDIKHLSITRQIIIIVGGFGSGKTEVSVNLAKYLYASSHQPVTLIDLDLVNPYFRTREAKDEMKELGIDLIAPEGGKFYADLPILLPQVRGLIENHEGLLIFDVGGDAQGAKALGSLSDLFEDSSYEMLMVLNSRRPQTSSRKSALETVKRIEATSRLKFTGLISNSHMIDDTDADIVREGYDLSLEIKKKTGLPIRFVSFKKTLIGSMDLGDFNCPILPLTRSLLKPWERKEGYSREENQ
ncbi:MAG: cobalamin biosynthesis protein CbiA [candidate division Zixibacteria bacterium]